MKKVALSLVGVLAAAAFAPEASAVPVFARQTGMACSACHFQHFPLLNGFGRSFKASGFTMIGAQGKVEGEHLDIPDRLNLGVFTTTYWATQSRGSVAGVAGPSQNQWGVPSTGGELSLFLGGRASDFAGYLAEAGLGGGGAANTGGIVGAGKLALLFPVADARVGLVIHSSNGQGAAYSFELLNTGAANTHKLMGNSGMAGQHVKATSASQYFGTNTAATGISLVANNDMGFINIGKYEMAGNQAVGGAGQLPLTYARGAVIMDLAGFDAGFGIQYFGGKSTVTGGSNVFFAGVANAPRATIVDGQLQGEMAGMPVGFYASYGTAPAGSATATNIFNKGGALGAAGTTSSTSFNVAAEVGVIPHVATVQVAARMAKTGAGVNDKDNAIMVAGTYELAQNIGLSLTYTTQSGSAWNTVAGTEPVGKTATTLLLETLF
ncbi:MAG: hypothetical protein HY849_10595 [Nitrosomonadales bacterium]|nr:hypothetical protein [Nitrosomonadales bacterium]